MSSTAFPVNDLVRRRFQTGLTLTTLALSVASTLFLLLFSSRIGFGISTATGTLTLGLNAIFSQFFVFIGVLTFLAGAVLTSFTTSLMMSQRTRDIGLIKAAGCPNNLIAGYFTTELLILTVASCTLGVFVGLIADFAAAHFLFPTIQSSNLWFAPLVFAVFLGLSLIFGIKPIIKTVKMPPNQALSPITYYSMEAERKHKPVSRRGFTWKLATRSLSRRYSATIRIIVLLSIVFLLLTVSVAGAVIAGDTTKSWVKETYSADLLVITHNSMGEQYRLLLGTFSGAEANDNFNYSDPQLSISGILIDQLYNLSSVIMVEQQLIVKEHVIEIANFSIDPETQATYTVGGKREADAIVIGVDPSEISGSWNLQGRFFNSNDVLQAVIGDSIAKTMYSVDTRNHIAYSDPLVQSVKIQNSTFSIVGEVVDPLNNGYVAYVPIEKLMNSTGILYPNLLLVKLDDQVNRTSAIAEIKSKIQSLDSDLNVFEIVDIMEENVNFLGDTWSTIMLVPLLTLVSASLCLISFMMLGIDEQRQEFAVLRAVGAKPRLITAIVTIQSSIILFSSMGVGLSLGIISTFFILMKHPLVTGFTVIEIASWFILALILMLICSAYPAYKLAKGPILRIIF